MHRAHSRLESKTWTRFAIDWQVILLQRVVGFAILPFSHTWESLPSFAMASSYDLYGNEVNALGSLCPSVDITRQRQVSAGNKSSI